MKTREEIEKRLNELQQEMLEHWKANYLDEANQGAVLMEQSNLVGQCSALSWVLGEKDDTR